MAVVFVVVFTSTIASRAATKPLRLELLRKLVVTAMLV